MSEKIDGAWLLHSSEPLPNEIEKIKRLYPVLAICIVIGLIFDAEFFKGVGGYGLMILFCVDLFWTRQKLLLLRNQKFRFVSGVSDDELFDKLQPALISKYGPSMYIEKYGSGSDCAVAVTYDNIIYEIYLNDDMTFRIRWGKSLGRAMAPSFHYKDYKKAIVAMGMIGYEIQKAFDVK